MDDPPQITLPGFNSSDISDRKLPGELYDGDTQCEFIYGAGWQRCQSSKASCQIFYRLMQYKGSAVCVGHQILVGHG